MSGRLEGKVAVVTGGGNGIGKACALRFAEEGAAVVVADLMADHGRAVVAEIDAVGGRAQFVHLDASSAEDNDAMAAAAVASFGGLDVLVTAAGISHSDYRSGDLENEIKWATKGLEQIETPARAFVEAGRDDWQHVIDVNLTGTLLAMQASVARMLELERGGSIVTIASVAAKHPDAGPLSYTVSKAGVWMLTKKAARMLGSAGIRVNSIGPGFIDTNMTAILGFLPEEQRNEFFGTIPLGRRGEPREIANTALFLASDEASYFTGEILHPDGGYFTE